MKSKQNMFILIFIVIILVVGIGIYNFFEKSNPSYRINSESRKNDVLITAEESNLSSINSDDKKDNVLIATEGSNFKEAVLEKVVNYCKENRISFSIVNVSQLTDIEAKKWDGIIILSAIINYKLDPAIDKFLENNQDYNEIFMYNTSTSTVLEKGDRKIDAITSASKEINIDKCASAIINFIDNLSATQSANMVQINGGTFTMGSPSSEEGRHSEEVQHQVTVNAFYMGKYEVTQKEWRDIVGTSPSNFKGDNLPVEQVSWFDAVDYCIKRSVKEGLTPAYTIDGSGDNRSVTWNRNANGYRLPTEAEWEYACRAGTTTPHYSGSSMDNAGWYSGNSENTTHPVGQKQANAWGLYDTHGNVNEWCWDWWVDYENGAQTDPTGPTSGSSRVIRGGSWGSSEQNQRSAFRDGTTPSGQHSRIGFRLARNTE